MEQRIEVLKACTLKVKLQRSLCVQARKEQARWIGTSSFPAYSTQTSGPDWLSVRWGVGEQPSSPHKLGSILTDKKSTADAFSMM